MTRQTTAARRQRKEAAAAEEFIDGAVQETRRRAQPTYNFTAEDIIRERDTNAQSWRKVAQVLGLGNPGAARRAYTALTGLAHDTSQPLVQRQPKGSFSGKPVARPDWDDDTDQDEIIQRMQGEWHAPRQEGKKYIPGHYDGCLVSIHRNHFGVNCTEDISVARVVGFKFDYDDHLEVEVVDRDSGARRTFYVTDIAKVR
jgi:hypothetical protein